MKYAWAAREYSPGAPAPFDGNFEQCTVLGSVTGVRVTLASGEKLPASPRGFTWRVIEPRTRTGAIQDASGRVARAAETE
jgi:hypothetical protein